VEISPHNYYAGENKMTQQKKETTRKDLKPYIPSRKSKPACKITSGIKAGWYKGIAEEIDKELN
jgi:hypothetical protein